MPHYLHYWAPGRAALAFDGVSGHVEALENGWFKMLTAGDTLWILSQVAGKLVVVLRGEVLAAPRRLRTHPPYAIRNSREFSNWKVVFDAKSASHPFAVPLTQKALGRLRFYGRSDRASGTLSEVLMGPLGSLRRLREATVGVLENRWQQREGREWLAITVSRGGQTVFGSAEHRSRVEQRAVATVRRMLYEQGWAVVSREREGVGYDLHCTRTTQEWHVEVKGTAATDPAFFITHGEYRRAAGDPAFRLAVVTNALTEPRVAWYTGVSFRKRFALKPLMYSASERS